MRDCEARVRSLSDEAYRLRHALEVSEAGKDKLKGIDAPIDRQVLSMSAKGCSSVQGEEKVREEGGRVLGRRNA